MSSWEKYLEQKRIEVEIKEFDFQLNLVKLMAVIAKPDKDSDMFNKAKSELLRSELISQARFKTFKEWVEKVEITESDYSPIEAALSCFET